MKTKTLLAALILCAGITTATAAEQRVNRGPAPGSSTANPWPRKLPDGSNVYWGLMETRNGQSRVIFGWYQDAPKVCYLHEQESFRNLGNWWERLLGRYRAEMVWIAVRPGETPPPGVGGEPGNFY